MLLSAMQPLNHGPIADTLFGQGDGAGCYAGVAVHGGVLTQCTASSDLALLNPDQSRFTVARLQGCCALREKTDSDKLNGTHGGRRPGQPKAQPGRESQYGENGRR